VPQKQKPIRILQQSMNTIISVKLKDERIFRGRLNTCDPYMNMTLTSAEELEGEVVKAKYGQVLIRGNNILWIQLNE
jgi:small nuclear ribonucleoprotein (snRNP)-like protein